MTRPQSEAPPISDRALNRATLARQGLLERQPVSAGAMLSHLIGMQGQVHNAPYVGLWSRLATFEPADLEALLEDRRAVRATIMRTTLHVAMVEDFLAIRPLIDPVTLRGFRANHLKPLKGTDVEAILAASRALLDHEALTPQALGRQLQRSWPELDPIALSMPARFIEPVVHVPPAGLWGATKAPELTTARRWLGRAPGLPMPLDDLVLRYLAAFGPATGNDFNAWSGLSGGAAAMQRLRAGLASFSGSDGRQLFDIPDAPRPDEETVAPVRFLPDYDNVIVGYADRSRILPPQHAKRLWRKNGLRPGFTVDGFIRGSWKLRIAGDMANLEVGWFEPLRSRDVADLTREGQAMIRGLLPGRKAEIAFVPFPPDP